MRTWAALLSTLLGLCSTSAEARPLLPAGVTGWADAQQPGVRGITVGPIENALHPQAGYGTAAGLAALLEARRMGANWVALTPFGRVWDLSGGGVDLTFETAVEQNRRDVLRTIKQARGLGLRVLLVPHLWVETGGWRALIEPADDAGWARWAASYGRFVMFWAEVAEQGGAEMLSVGVELRRWVTGPQAWRFEALIDEVRQVYSGLITYSANWDDLEHTVILGKLDVLGVNAFYPLATTENASDAELLAGGQRVAKELAAIAQTWRKPILLTEMGYTTRRDPALKPWEWPDAMTNVIIDERAQASAYRGLMTPLADAPWCAGFLIWRTYADPNDVSQEAEWGFSPRGKQAELILRDTFASHWAVDPDWSWTSYAGAQRARTPGVIAWEFSPASDGL